MLFGNQLSALPFAPEPPLTPRSFPLHPYCSPCLSEHICIIIIVIIDGTRGWLTVASGYVTAVVVLAAARPLYLIYYANRNEADSSYSYSASSSCSFPSKGQSRPWQVELGIDNDIERAGLRFKMVSKFNSYSNYVVLALTQNNSEPQ